MPQVETDMLRGKWLWGEWPGGIFEGFGSVLWLPPICYSLRERNFTSLDAGVTGGGSRGRGAGHPLSLSFCFPPLISRLQSAAACLRGLATMLPGSLLPWCLMSLCRRCFPAVGNEKAPPVHRTVYFCPGNSDQFCSAPAAAQPAAGGAGAPARLRGPSRVSGWRN